MLLSAIISEEPTTMTESSSMYPDEHTYSLVPSPNIEKLGGAEDVRGYTNTLFNTYTVLHLYLDMGTMLGRVGPRLFKM